MLLLRWLGLLLLLLGPHGFALGKGVEEEIAPGMWLLRSECGYWETAEKPPGLPLRFRPSQRIQQIAGRSFGCRLRLQTEENHLKLRVEITLPEAPKVWSRGGEVIEGNTSKDGMMVISPDRRSATTEEEYFIEDGFLVRRWRSLPGDPVGAYRIRIFHGDRLLRVFRFTIEAPTPP